MRIKIHRGTNEIGGSCVELTSGNSRIILDLGIPLVEKDGSRFDAISLRVGSNVISNERLWPFHPGWKKPRNNIIEERYRRKKKLFNAL